MTCGAPIDRGEKKKKHLPKRGCNGSGEHRIWGEYGSHKFLNASYRTQDGGEICGGGGRAVQFFFLFSKGEAFFRRGTVVGRRKK